MTHKCWVKPETTHFIPSLQNEMQFLTSYFDFFVFSSSVQLWRKLDGKNESYSKTCFYCKMVTFKSFIHCVLLNSSYQEIAGNNTRHSLYFEGGQEMLTQGVYVENVPLKICFLLYSMLWHLLQRTHAFDSRNLKKWGNWTKLNF